MRQDCPGCGASGEVCKHCGFCLECCRWIAMAGDHDYEAAS